ncbi:MAG: alpha/beta hydrolase [Candidatus Contendobacter sp.]|jgi:esterase/lipase superfamily enzyme|nr:alpha/beta hydrolase [Candidatus Contendobacter sp.]
MDDYVLSVRAVRNGAFVADVGPSKFLVVPPRQSPAPTQAITQSAWYKAVRTAAVWQNERGEARGDLLLIVHGYNLSVAEVIQRHRRLKEDLMAFGFQGVIVSFDWPSDDKALAYLPDRHRAKETAFRLVSDGIAYLSAQQTPACMINIHVFGHSTGAYVIREAFDDADDNELPNMSWTVSQVLFAAGDVSAQSMAAGNGDSESLYRHCIRLTNYASRYDQVLDLSNVKRLGVAPRVGRIGLPGNAPPQAVNVDCTAYYEKLAEDSSNLAVQDQPDGFVGIKSHSWYFGNRAFARDLFGVVIGEDRNLIPTRDVGPDGQIALKKP